MPQQAAAPPGSDAPTQAGPQPSSDKPAEKQRTAQPATPASEPAGTGVLRVPGAPPRDVPLMSIQQDRDEVRVEVGPISRETGVADVLLGSIGLVAVIVLASLVAGVIVGALVVFLKHRLGWGGPDKDAEDHISIIR